MKKDSFIVALLLILVGVFFVVPARAAETFFKSEGKPTEGNIWKVKLLITSRNEKINVLSGKVKYPSDLLKLVSIETAGSVVNFWIEPPRKGNGEISFAGMTPGGFEGEAGEIATVVFEGLKQGSAEVRFEEGEAYRNDGLGSKAEIKNSQISVAVERSNGAKKVEISDITPPQSFTAEIGKSNLLFDGKWFVAFNAVDKETGIDHYEIQEGGENPTAEGWEVATSPQVLRDQTLRSYVHIKAVDMAGNRTLSTVRPMGKTANFRNALFWGILLLLIASIAYLWRYLRGKGQKTP